MLKPRLVVAAAALMFATATPAMAGTFDVGPEASQYGGAARGYYFTAPKAFTITSLYVADTASQENQWAQVVRLNALPTTYPTLTNDFSNLGYFANQSAASAISTSIKVKAGDIIGILGTRSAYSVNSYGQGPYTSSIDGLDVTIRRLGFQDTLNNGMAYDLFTEDSSSNPYFSRTTFTFNAAGVPEPATWGLMILGFGAVGGAMRRRRSVAAKVRFA